MKKKIITKVIYVSPYRQQCLVLINGDVNDLLYVMKKMGTKGARKNVEYLNKELKKEDLDKQKLVDGTTYPLPYGFAITLKNNNKSTIIHECTHLAMMTLEKVGVPINIDNQEVLAYTIQDLVEQVTHIDNL